LKLWVKKSREERERERENTGRKKYNKRLNKTFFKERKNAMERYCLTKINYELNNKI
jgi:hypothetical protein